MVLKLSGLLRSRPDGFNERRCSFIAIGLAGFKPDHSKPSVQIHLWLCTNTRMRMNIQ
jgi:hypothetical protein